MSLGLHQYGHHAYLETAEDKKAKKADDDALTGLQPDMSTERVEEDLKAQPEYESLEAFVEYCMDDDRDSYTAEELQALSYNMRLSSGKVKTQLTEYGLKLLERSRTRATRGFSTNPNLQGNPMCGGSGFTTSGPGHVYRK